MSSPHDVPLLPRNDSPSEIVPSSASLSRVTLPPGPEAAPPSNNAAGTPA
jgi:hypothetical protein